MSIKIDLGFLNFFKDKNDYRMNEGKEKNEKEERKAAGEENETKKYKSFIITFKKKKKKDDSVKMQYQLLCKDYVVTADIKEKDGKIIIENEKKNEEDLEAFFKNNKIKYEIVDIDYLGSDEVNFKLKTLGNLKGRYKELKVWEPKQ